MFQNDYKKAITAEDLIRRYNLDGLKTDRKIIKTFNNSLTRQHTIIKDYITNITPYKGQADRLTAWFFKGVPTLNNKPYADFTEEEKVERENDLYYDKDSGYAYQYKIGNWEQVNGGNLIKSLALADSEPDTSDNKRNTYFSTPSPPYEIGDIWLDGNVIMRCRSTRSDGQFNSNDWITQDEYSNEIVLKDTRAVLDEFKETITTTYVTKVLLETTVDSINAEVDSKTTKITENVNGRFEETNEQISKLNIEVGNINASVQEINTDINGRIDTLSSDFNIEIGKISASVDSKIEDVSGNIQKVEGQLDLYIKKNDTGEVVSAFNLATNEVVINSDNFNLDEKGKVTCNDILIHGGKIDIAKNYTNDLEKIINDDAIVLKDTINNTPVAYNTKISPARYSFDYNYDIASSNLYDGHFELILGTAYNKFNGSLNYGLIISDKKPSSYTLGSSSHVIINDSTIALLDGGYESPNYDYNNTQIDKSSISANNIYIYSAPTASNHAVRLQDIIKSGKNGLCADIAQQDLNKITDTGFYYGWGLTNSPGTVYAGYLIALKCSADNSYILQIFVETNISNTIYLRQCTDGTWQSWFKFAGELA